MSVATIADTDFAVEAPRLTFPAPDHAPATRRELGALLIASGAVTPEQVAKALAEQQVSRRRLGEIVVDLGFTTSDRIAHALAEQVGLPYVDIRRCEVATEVATLLPENLAHRYSALPIYLSSSEAIVLAVADPTDVVAEDDLRIVLGHKIEFVVADRLELESAISRVYRTPLEIVDRADVEEETIAETLLEDVRDRGSTDAPAIRLVNQIVAGAVEENASDIHFEPQERELIVRARVDGVTRRIATIPHHLQAAVTSRLKIMGGLDIAERRAPQDGRITVRYGTQPMDIRIAVLPTTHGEQIVLRLLHRAGGPPSLEALGMSPGAAEVFLRSVEQPYGAVIAVGPTGSGKTTTLYAALDHLNEEGRVLTTIEDPVEWQIDGVNQVEVNIRAGLTFASGLRTLLRSDPDVVLVGEVRDEETARIAIQAAMTGHLVLTSLHTHNAAASIARLKDMGVEASLLATAINCIVAQRLARKLCLDCREPYQPDDDECEALGVDDSITLYRAAGCARCGGTGYRGRAAMYEVMPIRGRLRTLVQASTEEIFAAAVEEGMATLRTDGIRLCVNGISSLDEIRRVTGDRLS